MTQWYVKFSDGRHTEVSGNCFYQAACCAQALETTSSIVVETRRIIFVKW